MITTTITSPEGSVYYPISASKGDLPPSDLPTWFNVLFRQHAGVSLLRLHITGLAGGRNFYRLSIRCALRLLVRPRLTLIRLALIRNPWSYGVGVSRPHYRYLFLHLLFRSLQTSSRSSFYGCRNAPLPIHHKDESHGFGCGLMPVYYPCGATRLVSCYALFE